MTSLQFKSTEWAVAHLEPLAYQLDESQMFDFAPPRHLNPLGPKDRWDNRRVLLAFSRLVDSLGRMPRPDEDVVLHAEVRGSTDRKKYSRPGGNPRLAKDRKRSAVDALISIVDNGNSSNWYLQALGDELRRAKDASTEGEVQPQTRKRNSATLAVEPPDEEQLWPSAIVQSGPHPDIDAAWRAVAIRIWLTERDPRASTEMTMDLSPRSTLADMLYFSFISFTTTGYGDIRAVSLPARVLVIAENVLELVFTAILFTMAFKD